MNILKDATKAGITLKGVFFRVRLLRQLMPCIHDFDFSSLKPPNNLTPVFDAFSRTLQPTSDISIPPVC